jgi:hypothetical protein
MEWLNHLFARSANPAPVGAPVVGQSDDAGIDADHRLPGDPTHLIRIHQDWPQPFCARIADEVTVAGVVHRDVQRAVVAFIAGTQRRLALRPEPKALPGAKRIAVFGEWLGRSGRRRTGRLGWLPSDVTTVIADRYADVPLIARLRRIALAHAGKTAVLSVEVGRPARRRNDMASRAG